MSLGNASLLTHGRNNKCITFLLEICLHCSSNSTRAVPEIPGFLLNKSCCSFRACFHVFSVMTKRGKSGASGWRYPLQNTIRSRCADSMLRRPHYSLICRVWIMHYVFVCWIMDDLCLFVLKYSNRLSKYIAVHCIVHVLFSTFVLSEHCLSFPNEKGISELHQPLNYVKSSQPLWSQQRLLLTYCAAAAAAASTSKWNCDDHYISLCWHSDTNRPCTLLFL